MCADISPIEARFDLFRYRRNLRRGGEAFRLDRLKPASLVAIAAALFTAVGVAAWLGPDIRIGLAKDTSGMWDFIRSNGSQARGDRSATPWHDAPQTAMPSPGLDDGAGRVRAERHAARKVARKTTAPASARASRATSTAALKRGSAGPMLASAPVQAGQAVCVRLCDGFFFPVGNVRKAGDLQDQEAICHSLCPGAPTHAYIVPSGADTIDKAASREGQPYSALPVAFRHTHTADDTCTCHGPSQASHTANQALLMSLMRDVTLRRGDAVATSDGVRVFKGATHWPYKANDFLSLTDARGFEPKAAALLAIERAIKLPQTASPPRALSFAPPPVKTAKPQVAATLLPEVGGGRRIRLIGTDTMPAL